MKYIFIPPRKLNEFTNGKQAIFSHNRIKLYKIKALALHHTLFSLLYHIYLKEKLKYS